MIVRYFGRFIALIPGLLIAALLFVPGCGNDAPGDPVSDPIVPLPLLSELMKNFEAIYTEQLTDSLADLLHPDFQMILPSETCELLSRPIDAALDRAEMIAIHSNMFSGQPGRDESGNAIPAVDRIVIDVLEPQGAWIPITDETQFFSEYEGLWANYKISVQFYNTEQTLEYEVQQRVNFYVAEAMPGGNAEFQLLGIQGLGMDSNLATDLTSWDAVLVLFLPEPWVVENSYVGPAMCGRCHAEIYADFLVHEHAQPFMSEYVVDTDCGRCHTTGYDSVADTWEQDGVTCEACHGMGLIHSRSQAAQDIIINLDEEFCWGCHDIFLSHPYRESGSTFRGTSHSGGCIPCHDPHISARNDLERAIVTDCIDCHTPSNYLPGVDQSPHSWSR